MALTISCMSWQDARERYVELKPKDPSEVSLKAELQRTQRQLGDADYSNKPVPSVPE